MSALRLMDNLRPAGQRVAQREVDFAASSLLIGIFSAVAILAVGFLLRKWRQRIRERKAQHRQQKHQQLLDSLELLDRAINGLVLAALQGQESLAEERVYRLAQAINAANLSGDDDLRRLVSIVAERCDALSKARREQDKERLNLLMHQLGESQRRMYRRMETLLDQSVD